MPSIMTVGYNTALLGGVLTLKSFDEQFHEINASDDNHGSYASTIQGIVMALYPVGGLIGSLSCVWLGDRFGRRRIIMAGSAVQIVGAAAMSSAYSFAHLMISRIILGIGTGALLATVPVWQSEISPANRRGTHVVTKGVFNGIGCALALFLDFGMSSVRGSLAWRFPCGFPIFLSLIVAGLILLLPESPRWLIQQGRVSEARECLSALLNTNLNDQMIETSIKEMQSSLDLARHRSPGQIFNMGPQRSSHRATLAAMAMVCAQLTGATPITFYGKHVTPVLSLDRLSHTTSGLTVTEIFEKNLSLNQSISNLLAAIYQLVGPIGGILCVYTIERCGRRALMLISAMGNVICLALAAGLGSQTDHIPAIHGAVAFIFLFHFSCVIGFGGIPYLYATEIAPLHLRATIFSVSVSITWIFSVLIANITPIALKNMGQKYFFIFAGFNAAIIPLVYYTFPETAGRTLEEMDEIFAASEGFLHPVRVAMHLTPAKSCEFGKSSIQTLST